MDVRSEALAGLEERIGPGWEARSARCPVCHGVGTTRRTRFLVSVEPEACVACFGNGRVVALVREGSGVRGLVGRPT